MLDRRSMLLAGLATVVDVPLRKAKVGSVARTNLPIEERALVGGVWQTVGYRSRTVEDVLVAKILNSKYSKESY